MPINISRDQAKFYLGDLQAIIDIFFKLDYNFVVDFVLVDVVVVVVVVVVAVVVFDFSNSGSGDRSVIDDVWLVLKSKKVFFCLGLNFQRKNIPPGKE